MTVKPWPTMQDYMNAVRQQHLPVDVTEILYGEQQLNAVRIGKSPGSTVIALVEDMDDPLMSTTIAQLDRRLGIKSHLFQ